ncbi:peptidoglycan D,D-transpeptidase FtsI family protein [Cyanobacterium sp. IPPAS B-1200]|uniref:peptidoglycan D,D-transpeptidase FtsI family protein n=1 Tax=Cyanobacterium sp. IPPAS B-1200 TaxID=1562720 RepID=UPI0008526CDD|nr:penicillin-binding protein 2 [Cyanobacterium sp. IPPAS B-1200]OEJ77451.1 cell division protein FtsI [Cyanobacterium sp. IPPAS B-1200]
MKFLKPNFLNALDSPPFRKKNSRRVKSHKVKRGNFTLRKSWGSVVRIILVWLVLIMGMVGIGYRLYHLQIVKGQEYFDRAEGQQKTNLRRYIPRRSIIDSDGRVIASDQLVYDVYAHRLLLEKDINSVARDLAEIIPELDVNGLVQRINAQETGVIVARNLTENQADRVRGLGIIGVDLDQRYSRFYPQDDLWADVVGYVDMDHNGQAGIEHSQGDLLQRDLSSPEVRGMLQVRRNALGSIIPASLPDKATQLDDLSVKLTVDSRLQRAVRDRLRVQMDQFKAKKGAVIVLDAQTGGILSLACEPTYNPNNYSAYDFALFKNWSVTDTYEPGSTFKPVNVAIALDEGVINPDSYVSDPAQVMVDGWPIANASRTGLGRVTITKALDVSSNTAMIDIMRRIPRARYFERLEELGINERMGLDLPFEGVGFLKSEEVFTARDIEMAVSSFGQGLSLTPMKLAQIQGAIANGGKLITPHVVEGLVDSNGQIQVYPEIEETQVFKESSADAVVKMMESVVKNGTGAAAQIEGYNIGGKTGTAQKHDGRGRYSATARITSFVSILPTDNPRYVVLAVIDEPQGDSLFGSTVAAPIVKDVMKSLIRIKGIPPSN